MHFLVDYLQCSEDLRATRGTGSASRANQFFSPPAKSAEREKPLQVKTFEAKTIFMESCYYWNGAAIPAPPEIENPGRSVLRDTSLLAPLKAQLSRSIRGVFLFSQVSERGEIGGRGRCSARIFSLFCFRSGGRGEEKMGSGGREGGGAMFGSRGEPLDPGGTPAEIKTEKLPCGDIIRHARDAVEPITGFPVAARKHGY